MPGQKIIDPETERLLRLLRREALELLKDWCPLWVVSPMMGHCVQMSLLVIEIAGGELMFGRWKRSTTHYWNRLSCGIEVDLTSCQFGGDGWNPVCKGKVVEPPVLDLETMFLARALLKKLSEVIMKGF